MSRLPFDASRLGQAGIMGILVLALMIFFQFITGSHMLASANLQNIVTGNAHIFVLAIGMVLVVTIGQLDLSVGSVAAFSSMSMAIIIANLGLPWWVGLLLGMLIGTFIGLIQGLFVAKVGLPAFIVTVGGMIILRGGVQWESQALSVPLPHRFQTLGSGYLPSWGSIFGIDTATVIVGVITAAVAVTSIVRTYFRRRARLGLRGVDYRPWVKSAIVVVLVGVFTWLFGTGREGTSFPVPGVVVLVLIFIYHFMLTRTQFGRHLQAVGGNIQAASLSGVRVTKIQCLVMVNMGMLSALAGMMFAGRATAVGPQDGLLWELEAIAAVFIGGAAVAGGRGSVFGAVLGATLMAVLSNGLLLVGLGSDRAQVVKGIVLLAAVTLDVYGKKQSPLHELSRTQFSF